MPVRTSESVIWNARSLDRPGPEAPSKRGGKRRSLLLHNFFFALQELFKTNFSRDSSFFAFNAQHQQSLLYSRQNLDKSAISIFNEFIYLVALQPECSFFTAPHPSNPKYFGNLSVHQPLINIMCPSERHV